MNIAHIAFYANKILEDLNLDTFTVAFWRGLFERRGDTSIVPHCVAELNDTFRKSVLRTQQPNGKACITPGIQALGSMAQAYIFQLVINHSRFPEGNDPYGEHDFGVIEVIDLPKIYWKIDYYSDADMEYGTEDKINCYRVLVIMLAEEY